MPDHWDRRTVNHAKHWDLSHYRSLHYSQTPTRVAHLIWKEHIYPKVRNRDRSTAEMKDLDSAYWHYCRGHREAEFVATFRKQHPDDYVKLFG